MLLALQEPKYLPSSPSKYEQHIAAIRSFLKVLRRGAYHPLCLELDVSIGEHSHVRGDARGFLQR